MPLSDIISSICNDDQSVSLKGGERGDLQILHQTGRRLWFMSLAINLRHFQRVWLQVLLHFIIIIRDAKKLLVFAQLEIVSIQITHPHDYRNERGSKCKL